MNTLRTLKRGSSGQDVQMLQNFLTGHGFPCGLADGKFGDRTETAVKGFQRASNLVADGIVGSRTWAVLLSFGMDMVVDRDRDLPERPDNVKAITSNDQRMRKWGRFEFRAAPTSSDPERITILGDWVNKTIVGVTCPVFGIRVNLHREVADSYVELMEAVKKEKLAHLLLTHEGAFVARFIRGSRTTLSNHSWGTAFDVNYSWNKLGATPAFAGQKGSVREIVPIALAHGWYWGGWFTRRDGMHFEKLP